MTDTSVCEWMSVAQTARALGLTPQRVRQLADAGALRHERTAIGRLVDPESVKELKKNREAGRLGPMVETAA